MAKAGEGLLSNVHSTSYMQPAGRSLAVELIEFDRQTFYWISVRMIWRRLDVSLPLCMFMDVCMCHRIKR